MSSEETTQSLTPFISTADIRLRGKYITRVGDVVTLIEEIDHEDWDFIGDNNRFYTADGGAQRFHDSPHDLVAEVFHITIGKSYVTRGTNLTVKIIGLDDARSHLYRRTHPYLGDDGEVYTKEGLFNDNIESEHDLVKEL